MITLTYNEYKTIIYMRLVLYIIIYSTTMSEQHCQKYRRIRIMLFNDTFNNISVISWWLVLLVEETGVSGERPQTCRKSLINFTT